MFSRFLKGFLLIAILSISMWTNAQLSKTHYIPPLTAADSNSSNPLEQYIYLSTPKNFDVPFKIIPIGLPASSIITGVVSNTNSREINLGTGYGQLFIPSPQTSVVSNKGYIIEAEDVIYVSVRMIGGGGAQASALVSKGLAAPGTTFRVGSFTNENPQDNYLNFASVMATEDNTEVTFDDLPTGLSILNYTGTFPIKAILNKGQSYVVATNSKTNTINKDGLIGTLITSTKPIVVNCGSANGSFHNGGGRDYGIDQIVGLEKVGKKYIFVKGGGINDWENILIVAHENNTTISINGIATGSTINAGEYYLIEGDKYSPVGNMFVETSKSVFAYQGVGATNSEANQELFFVPPLNCETRGNLDNIAKIQSIGATTFTGGVTIVTKKGATVSINNTPISNFSPSGPYDVLGNPDYITYKVTGLFENISVQSDEELYCAYFNFNGAATSGSFYSGFPTAPEINFDAAFETLGICIPNIKLQVANMGNFDSVEWFFDDGNGGGFISLSNTTTEHIPTVAGKYKLIGKLNCSGLTLESNEVPVSICPDDVDDDGIIDNIDIDNDNDGILNCTESQGNQAINLSNINSGTIPVGSYTFTGIVTPQGSGLSNTVVGNSSGTFLTSLQGKGGLAESSILYTIDFNKKLNLKLVYAASTSLGNGILNNDEEFYIEVPTDRTITLLDPDDQLLVDTNYDGVYESGITQISSFQIRFKVKNTSLAVGTGTFSFVANGVDLFRIYHKNNSDTQPNLAAFELTTTCVAKDSDGDGIEDALDADSDNDGIPDRIENVGKLISLSLVDANIDGLDDIFDATKPPLDTDKDGVFDFYDLDSDNDGIYDLFESGSTLPDSNNDGIIDNANAIIGANGWVNSAETTPDSNAIGYTITNLDADSLFNYIDLDSDGDVCSDVLEAGFLDGNNDGFLGDSTVSVNSQGKVTNATGYTTPNINYSTTAIITIIDQPTAQISCDLDTTVFTINATSADSFQWQLSTDGTSWSNLSNNATYSGATSNTLQIANTPLSFNNYLYRVELNKIGNSCGLLSNEVKLTVNPLPIANPVQNIQLCDDLTDGDDTNGIVQNFNLESQTATILGTQSATNFKVTYHESLIEAQNGTNPIMSPFENKTSPNSQEIYVRVLNTATNCVTTNLKFSVIVNAIPIATKANDIVFCDDLNDGNDTNGIVQHFNLNSQTSTILGTQSANDFAVSYHLSKVDAISGNNALSSPHENKLSPNTETIYVRVLNKITGCVNPHTTFNLVVTALPIANTVSNIELCDNNLDGNDTNGIVQGINLEGQTATILGSQNPLNYTVTYHFTANDAITGVNKISSPYTNVNSPNNQTIYVRILDKITGCVNPHLTFQIIVHPLPKINYNVVLKQCDNDIDGFSYFNLTEVNDEISINASNEIFTYFNSYNDALSKINEIANPIAFENKTISADKVWARVESQFGCFRISEIQLYVSTTGIPATFQRTFFACDDFLDTNGANSANNDDRDGISSFNFSSVDAEVRSIFPNGQQLIIFYYRNEADALAEINPIADISNYRNIGYPTMQQIYIRVDSQVDNDCLGFGSHITLNVEKLPIANPVIVNRQCDDDYDGFFAFDVSHIHSTVLGGQTNVTVTYFDQNNNPLPSPLPNPFVTTSQIIKIRVTNNATNTTTGPCFDETLVQFTVDKKPIANLVIVAGACDDESNDGWYEFNTATIESSLLGTQTGMEVHYYNAQGSELPSPLPNPFNTKSQTIKAVVLNAVNKTCEASTFIDFNVKSLPDFSVNSPQILCVTNPQTPLVIDVTPAISTEIYSYDWKDSNGVSFSKNATADIYKEGIYTVTLTNANGCSRTRSIEIIASELAKISYDTILVEDDSENNKISIINIPSLGIGDYEFSITDANYGYQDEPEFDFLAAGNYNVFVRDKNGCGVAQIEVSVIGFPKFFTPNNDGYNDTWKVLGINKSMYPSATIYIFNRFGKLITKINPDDNGWDGYFNGSQLPASDYWFTVELTDYKGFIRIRKGHFSLIRR